MDRQLKADIRDAEIHQFSFLNKVRGQAYQTNKSIPLINGQHNIIIHSSVETIDFYSGIVSFGKGSVEDERGVEWNNQEER